MKPVEIYTTPTCPYCHAAKRLLTKKGAAFTEIDVSRDPDLRQAMMQRAMRGWRGRLMRLSQPESVCPELVEGLFFFFERRARLRQAPPERVFVIARAA